MTAPLCVRNLAHGNSDRQRSIVVESSAYRLLIQFHSDRIVRIHRAGDADEHLSEIGEYAPVVCFVGIGQIAPGDSPAKSHVVELAWD